MVAVRLLIASVLIGWIVFSPSALAVAGSLDTCNEVVDDCCPTGRIGSIDVDEGDVWDCLKHQDLSLADPPSDPSG